MKALIKSFRYAGRGIIFCLKNERNMRIHVSAAFYLFLFLPFFELTRGQTALLLLTVAVVMAAEAVNTSIEAIVNRLLPSYDQLARVAKDAAAGAVLLCAFFSALIGLLLLWQPAAFSGIYAFFADYPALLAALAFFLTITFCFVFGGFGFLRKIIKRLRFNKRKM